MSGQGSPEFAALGLGFLAAQFVSEPESWPVFLAWLKRQEPDEGEPELTREEAEMLVAELGRGLHLMGHVTGAL